MLENAYDLDIALDVVFSLWKMKCDEFDNELNPDKKCKLQDEIDMMRYEREMVTFQSPSPSKEE